MFLTVKKNTEHFLSFCSGSLGSLIKNDKDCFIYPDLKTCLVGTFNEKGQAVRARQARIVGLCEEQVNINFLVFNFGVTE